MEQHKLIPSDFWDNLEHTVAVKVGSALNTHRSHRTALVAYLRDLEELARTECDRRQTVQIIASGRSLLGDHETVGPARGPFVHGLDWLESAGLEEAGAHDRADQATVGPIL